MKFKHNKTLLSHGLSGLLLAGLLLPAPLSFAAAAQPGAATANDTVTAPSAQSSLSDQWIADQIYRNECASKPDNLVHWNSGEQFPSLGIGHFIWYPAGSSGPFEESFPALLEFMQQQGVILPAQLRQALAAGGAPWADKSRFDALKKQGDPELLALQQFLEQTRQLQFAFIRQRFDQQLPQILAGSVVQSQAELEQKVSRLLATPTGYYPLIDYLHFKGSGITPNERYHDTGWGVLQVLELMSLEADDPLLAFAQAADAVLTRRVALAPQARNESRWLPGWRKRVAGYAGPLTRQP